MGYHETWAEHFSDLLEVIKLKSKDQSTQLGAIITGSEQEILSTGYNGLPRGVEYTPERYIERPEKYLWMEHAERNAIYNAARNGVAIKNATLWTQALPCVNCARGIIQVGIRRVVLTDPVNGLAKPENWVEEQKRTSVMFKEAGVEIVKL